MLEVSHPFGKMKTISECVQIKNYFIIIFIEIVFRHFILGICRSFLKYVQRVGFNEMYSRASPTKNLICKLISTILKNLLIYYFTEFVFYSIKTFSFVKLYFLGNHKYQKT